MILKAMAEEKTRRGEEKKPAIETGKPYVQGRLDEMSEFRDRVDSACRLEVKVEITGFS